MDGAASMTYISKRQLEQYAQKRKQLQDEKRNQSEQLPVKKFNDNEEQAKPDKSKQVGDNQEELKETASFGNDQVAQNKGGIFGDISSTTSFGQKKLPEMIVEEAEELDRNLSCEEVDSDDMCGGLCDSDSDDGQERRKVFKAVRKEKKVTRGGGGSRGGFSGGSKVSAAKPMPKPKKYNQEFDTNVFEVKLDCLGNKGEVATGDAEICKACQGVFSKISVLKTEAEQQIWTCEYCNTKNEVEIDNEEVPKTQEVTYLIEAAAQVQDKKIVGQDISVIFCLDISGSMCVTQAIDGKHKIKGDKTAELNKEMKKFGDGSDQFINNQDKGKTWVSRVQCVKAAIETQIDEMSKGADQRKVGIVTFNNEVSVIGDATKDPQTITGDHLNNIEYLKANGKVQGAERLQKSVGVTKKVLLDKIAAIEETGPTALGPAIVTSVCMAAEGKQGSTVVICTDGLANIGLGAFDDVHTEEDMQKADTFYEIVGQIAQTAGVTVNIVSIEGDECNMDSLSKLAEMTGGSVERVDPTTLTKNFANMLQMPVIATNVESKVKIHKGLQFRNELDKDVSDDKTLLVKQFGNITAESIFTFEYGLKPISELLKMQDLDITEIKNFPFQAQISYTALDGSKCLRVITKQQQVCNEREVVQQEANYDMLSYNCMQRATTNARAGDLGKAQAIMKGFKRGMKSNMCNNDQEAAYQDMNSKIGSVYAEMGEQIHELSDGEEEMLAKPTRNQTEIMKTEQAQAKDQFLSFGPSKKSKGGPPKSKFAGKQNDALASQLYQMSSHTQSVAFRAPTKSKKK